MCTTFFITLHSDTAGTAVRGNLVQYLAQGHFGTRNEKPSVSRTTCSTPWATAAPVLRPLVNIKLIIFHAYLFNLLNNCFIYCWNPMPCVWVTAADLVSLASPSHQDGAALLILFYLRAPLNINTVFSVNYRLAGLPTLSAFIYLALFPVSTFPPCISIRCSSLSLSTPKVNFWWYLMWWLVGSHSPLSCLLRL